MAQGPFDGLFDFDRDDEHAARATPSIADSLNPIVFNNETSRVKSHAITE
jgi:hypothetical protein